MDCERRDWGDGGDAEIMTNDQFPMTNYWGVF